MYKEAKVQDRKIQGYDYLGLIPCFAAGINNGMQAKTHMLFDSVYTHKYK